MKKETIILQIQKRGEEKPNSLRSKGIVPGVIYGKIENMNVMCDVKNLTKTFNVSGESQIVELHIDGKNIPCLIHAITRHPVTSIITHVDFYAVDMAKKVTTHIPVHTTGEAPVVKELNGILVTIHHEVEVSCLPKDLPSEFIVDLTKLVNFETAMYVSDITVPTGVTILTPADTMLIHAQEPRKEEVKEVVPVATETAAPAAATEKKEEKK